MIKVGTLGLWHLGCVYSACLAKKGIEVTGFDLDKKVVENLQRNISPIFEPGLEELIKKHNLKNLVFTTSEKEAISGKDYIFITLDTPVNNQDIISLELFNRLVNTVAKHIAKKTILVISSQVPVGTCRLVQTELKKSRKDNPVLYFPENLRLGQAIDVFLNPDRIVLGGDHSNIRKKFLSDFSFLKSPTLEMSLESAEMSKHALNSYLALMISFSSEIGDICELLGADANDVASALKMDKRVSKKAPINPGIGFAGGTLGRDLQTLKMVSKKVGYLPKLTHAVYKVNQDRLPNLVKKMQKALGTIKGKKIGLLGLTYKPDTNTLRRSQSLDLASLLNKAGADIRAIDPAIKSSTNLKNLKVSETYDEFLKDLDAVVLMTGWEDFKKLKPAIFSTLMKRKIVFDARNFLDRAAYEKKGFLYVGIGKG